MPGTPSSSGPQDGAADADTDGAEEGERDTVSSRLAIDFCKEFNAMKETKKSDAIRDHMLLVCVQR